jgi:hypothetical protein
MVFGHARTYTVALTMYHCTRINTVHCSSRYMQSVYTMRRITVVANCRRISVDDLSLGLLLLYANPLCRFFSQWLARVVTRLSNASRAR